MSKSIRVRAVGDCSSSCCCMMTMTMMMRQREKLMSCFDLIEAIVLFLVHVTQMKLVDDFHAEMALDKMLVGIFIYLFDTFF